MDSPQQALAAEIGSGRKSSIGALVPRRYCLQPSPGRRFRRLFRQARGPPARPDQQAGADNQFVFTQQRWANGVGFPQAPSPPGLDALIGQDATQAGGQVHPKKWDDASGGTEPFDFKGFVTMKGGEFFFAPSLTFLRGL